MYTEMTSSRVEMKSSEDQLASISRCAGIGKCMCIIKAWVSLPVFAAAARAAELVIPSHDLLGCVHGQCLLDGGHHLGAALLVNALEDGQAQVHVLYIA